jgi:hypothetical protein
MINLGAAENAQRNAWLSQLKVASTSSVLVHRRFS